VLLHLDGSRDVLPAHGSPVLSGDVPVGWVGTAARHWTDGPVATALVKRATPTDAPLTADGVPAAQVPVVISS
jgi:folate-binding Fe-S cluster repair protein YgfZ